MSALFRHLNLVGQVNSWAGDPQLDAALKKLITDAFAPLKKMNDFLGRPDSPLQASRGPLTVALVLANGGTFHPGQEIVVEARLTNVSDEAVSYPRGFGATSRSYPCQLSLSGPDGRFWAAEARPLKQFQNYRDIVLRPRETVTIGRWDLSKLTYNPGRQYRTMGGEGDQNREHFDSVGQLGKYVIRWWDGRCQERRWLLSSGLELAIAEAGAASSSAFRKLRP